MGNEFSEIRYVDFDAFEKNTIPSTDFIEVDPIMSISTESYLVELEKVLFFVTYHKYVFGLL